MFTSINLFYFFFGIRILANVLHSNQKYSLFSWLRSKKKRSGPKIKKRTDPCQGRGDGTRRKLHRAARWRRTSQNSGRTTRQFFELPKEWVKRQPMGERPRQRELSWPLTGPRKNNRRPYAPKIRALSPVGLRRKDWRRKTPDNKP